jgi:myo-inositol 2-dehydrogenase / D-chiro-inositol 1-dehydrogenase
MSDAEYQLNNWYHFLWLCGDHIVEQHVHNLDVINWAMNSHPIRAFGMGGRSHRQVGDPAVVGHIFDHFAVEYEYPNGVRMFSFCRQIPGCWNSVSEAIAGSKGVSQVNNYTINGKSVGSDTETSAYVQEHIDLIRSIREGKPLNELKSVTESTLTAIMGRMSTYTGVAVTWQQALDSKENLMPQNLTLQSSLTTAPTPVPGKTKLV